MRLYNKNPAMLPSHLVSIKQDKRYYGPHLGVSFAHLSFLSEVEYTESAIRMKNKDLSNKIMNETYYLEPMPEYVAYKDLEPQIIKKNLCKERITDKLQGQYLKKLYDGEFIERYNNLSQLTSNGIPCSGNTLGLTKGRFEIEKDQEKIISLEKKINDIYFESILEDKKEKWD